MLVLILLTQSCARDDLDSRSARAATFTIQAEGCSLVASRGVGIAIGDIGTIVTVAHTIAGATRIVAIDHNAVEHVAVVRSFDPEADLAVLEIIGPSSPGLRLGRAEPGGRAEVVTVRSASGTTGVPATIEKFISVTIDDIYREATAHRSALELKADIVNGDSGAGVLDDNGDVVGVIYAMSRGRQGVAFALDDHQIRLALDAAKGGTVSNGHCT